MFPRAAILFAAAAAGCASAPRPEPEAAAEECPVPDILLGIPVSVVVERALFDLDSGDPERAARAREVLLAIPAGPAIEPLHARFHGAPRGSVPRLDTLAILAERGECPEGCDVGEIVEVSLREIARGDASGRPALLAVERIRSLGEGAREPLRAAARDGGAASGVAGSLLRVVFHEAAPSTTVRP
jgi:hypothetical protein